MNTELINTTNLNFLLETLKILRELKSEVKYSIDKTQEELEKTDLYKYQLEEKVRFQELTEQISDAEEAIREIAVALSSKDNYETREFNGVKVKQFNIINILDESKAKLWASQYMPEAVKLTISKFNSGVRNLELPFIQKEVEYRAQIPSNLS
jgi:hypothetical protein